MARSGWSATCATRPRWTPPWPRRWREFGGLDAVVANAGVGSYGPFLELAARAGGRDDRREPQGHAPHGARRAPAPDRVARATSSRCPPWRGCAASRARPSTTPRSSVSSASRARSTTRCASSGVRVTNVCPGGIATDFAMGTGRTPDMPELEGMMSAGGGGRRGLVRRLAPEGAADDDRVVPADERGLVGMTLRLGAAQHRRHQREARGRRAPGRERGGRGDRLARSHPRPQAGRAS